MSMVDPEDPSMGTSAMVSMCVGPCLQPAQNQGCVLGDVKSQFLGTGMFLPKTHYGLTASYQHC